MRLRFSFFLVIFTLIISILYGCVNEPANESSLLTENNMIVIEHQADSTDYMDGGSITTIDDDMLISEMNEIYSSLTYEYTSRPMQFPRFVITFYTNGEETVKWTIDEENTMSSFDNTGNVIIQSDIPIYQYIADVFGND